MDARLETAIRNIVDIFMEYADDEGKKNQLSQEELKKLLDSEIKSEEFKVRDSAHSLYMMLFLKYMLLFIRRSGVLLFNSTIVFSRKKSIQLTSRRPLSCWIKTTMAWSTSASSVGVCLCSLNATSTRRQAGVARKARAKGKMMKQRTKEDGLQSLKMFVAP